MGGARTPDRSRSGRESRGVRRTPVGSPGSRGSCAVTPPRKASQVHRRAAVTMLRRLSPPGTVRRTATRRYLRPSETPPWGRLSRTRRAASPLSFLSSGPTHVSARRRLLHLRPNGRRRVRQSTRATSIRTRRPAAWPESRRLRECLWGSLRRGPLRRVLLVFLLRAMQQEVPPAMGPAVRCAPARSGIRSPTCAAGARASG